ncbi:MAG: FAD-dependent oxidoreductase [Flavobacteriaceae bacterium]|nr:FAD-dependent oxidoreductase [Flavobacteriaceae bacterium]|tara:strand:+ start:11296 stop:12363 length:1068 start_codon:yes stop_codon:yes gene_type:complete
MKKVDYIVVGFGIAGVCLAERLQARGKSFRLIDNALEGATAASGGVLNPTVLKRFTAAWNAASFFKTAIPFYKSLGERIGVPILKDVAIHRILHSVEEQNNWMVASDKKELESFLSSEILTNKNTSVAAPLGLGNVKGGVLMHPEKLINAFRNFLKASNILISENFEHDLLKISGNHVEYKDVSAKHIIFCEGASIVDNPFFPLSVSPNRDKVFVGNKGEYVIFKAPKLKLNSILKGPMMIIPLGNDLYKVGASYGRDDFSKGTTKDAREEIVSKLKRMISCDFEVVNQVSGIRPTVKDRKPLLGKPFENKPIYFMNGLGTRGLSMAPLLSEWLLDSIAAGKPLPAEVNINRFLK